MSRVERMFGPREHWGKDGEMDRVREQTGKSKAEGRSKSAEKPERRCQADKARNGNEKRERPEGGAREARKAGFNLGNHPGISGFVSIRCGGCGKLTNTCLREKRSAFACRSCGHETPMDKVANIHFKCSGCGFTGQYRTNRTEKEINMECLNCSTIVPMKRIRRGNYVPEVEV